MTSHLNSNGAIIDRSNAVGADGLADAERRILEADFLREPSLASRSQLAAWRERKRAA